jgi:hypothetical protein
MLALMPNNIVAVLALTLSEDNLDQLLEQLRRDALVDVLEVIA